jgi:carbon monoxide dehydrogenase subunit G
MDLTHEFTVPTTVEETWSHFQDIASVAECFPGAQVTSAEGDTFTGTCKVKLGPIALVYAGSGTFVERDEAEHRFVVEAKGKDKRGNGTAGATVTLTMAPGTGPSDGGTDVKVVTDLAITGKPAQFGRGVMQDVSDKLLGQFVACLEQRLAAPDGATEEPPADTPAGANAPASAGPSAGTSAGTPSAAAGTPAPQPVQPTAWSGSSVESDDAADLGAALLPVLVKSYGRQIAAGLVVVLLLGWLVRRRRR